MVVCLLTPAASNAAPTPTPKPAATPAATPAVSPAASPTASPVTVAPTRAASYSGTQQMDYLATARDGFITLRQSKSQPFVEAQKALEDAGGVGPKGLNSKADITARRDLVAKCLAGNQAYLEFIKTQEDAYRAELAKTPLIPEDVASVTSVFASHANTASSVKLRETDQDALKTGDEMLAYLEKTYGKWTVSADGKLLFKKNSDLAAYGALSRKYNKSATDAQAMLTAINAANVVPPTAVAPTASPAASMSPAPSPGAAASASPSPKH